jgi:thiamine pyrophosphokinase
MNKSLHRAWLITPQAPPQTAVSYSSISENDLIIAIDGGFKRCLELNLSPHILIGDLDSLDAALLDKILPGCEKIIHPAQKDETDTQLAVQYCVEHKVPEIFVCNDLGGRFDHSLALVQNLLQAHRNGLKASIVSSSQILQILDSRHTFTYPVNTIISLISITEKTDFISSKGLAYPLNNLTLYNWQSRGISNHSTESIQTIEIAEGTALAIINV